ncbi:hypothetical protein SOVF_035080 [Spinacia oleracea]|uniref:Homeobox protein LUMINIDEPENDENS n=1 Tax=Spinacia oleracea TaxID=3562 RepID=A0A9R0IJB0_SPIOL|nr:homeobox protein LUMINIDEPENDENS [Spinacia oleracea]KNA22330.1 hypothetical protein SOVF_035080 [Spinacia oleracea]
MDLLKDYPSEIEIGSSIDSFQKGMDSQKQLFHTQIDQLRNIVVTQCKLTGVNPLSQEMAAGALSINIGKKPRDLLNPKAAKYMQAVFSMKDAISKKESREIGALFGLTVTQVREYFASQRSRVRKLTRLSRERAIRASGNKELQDGVPAESDLMLPIETAPLSSVGPSNVEEAPSCSNQDEVLPGLGESERHFVDNIFSSMCKEETFSGQVKLMEWILQIENPTILSWFLIKGGVMILATWLSQAASEEQTSVISAALKVFCHLPLNKALPAHMSALLQGVNKLRFYRVRDISNRARILLSKWSKMFVKIQASKKPNGIRAAGEQEIDLTRRIGEIVGDFSWQSSVDNSDDMLVTSYVGPDDIRKVETLEAMKLLTASSDDSNKRLLGTTASHNKERRKVQLVEQPGQKAVSNSQSIKAVPANQRRPITADEIQKAKMRAQFMQSNKRKTEGPRKPSLLTNDLLSASEAYLRPKLEAQKKARLLPPKSIIKQMDCLSDQKPAFDQKESLMDKCRRVQIPWWAPPEIDLAVEIGSGESSKETEVQRNRIHREKETTYPTLEDVPPNPKEPWDVEMDYDDTLTPEIPVEQLPDADGPCSPLASAETHNPSADPSTLSQAEPDLELLAVLLKNPELVFALTSGQASGLSSEDTVKLLDLLKSNGGAALLNGASEKQEEVKVEVSLPSPTPTPTRNAEVSLPSPTPPSRFEVSLPSPTPSTNPGPNGWTSTEAAKNPFSRRAMGVQDTMTVTTAVISSDRSQNSCSLQPQYPSTGPGVITSLPQHLPCQTHIPEYQPAFYDPVVNQNPPTMNSSYSRPTPAHSQSQIHAHSKQYLMPEDNNARQGLSQSHNSRFSNHVSQNVYNQTMTGGPTWERNDYPTGSHKGYESWSPENSPGPSRYPPEHHHGHGHGHGWSYPEQRERGYAPPDRISRHQNWRGSGGGNGGGGGRGGVNRRWNGGDRRR